MVVDTKVHLPTMAELSAVEGESAFVEEDDPEPHAENAMMPDKKIANVLFMLFYFLMNDCKGI
jgi:hypothetical protein